MNQIDIIITCMGRLDHLKQSLPLALGQANTNCIIVDYSCPDGCGDWVENNMPGAQVVRVPGKKFFNTSIARNAGAKAGLAPWIFFLDADMLLDRLSIEELVLPELSEDCFFTFSIPENRPDISGQCICPRKDFEHIGGYDEVFQGWGREDKDLYERFLLYGLKRKYLPGKLLSTLSHDDGMRVKYFENKDKLLNQLINYLYCRAKLTAEKISGNPLSVKVRQNIYDKARKVVVASLKSDNGGDLILGIGKESVLGVEINSTLHYHLDPVPGRSSINALTSSKLPGFRSVLDLINRRWPGFTSQSTEEPLFLLAAGHRSGSTLVQRMMMERRWMWGEPYGRGGLIDNLSLTFRAFTKNWPQDRFFLEQHSNLTGIGKQTWIANLYPDLSGLVEATQQYLLTLFKAPANAKGYQSWGLKEVTLDCDMAFFLKWLFPRSRFILLIRNPYDAYLSYLRRKEIWFTRWPQEPLNSPEAFGAQWVKLSSGFMKNSDKLNALVIRYEEIVGDDFDWTILAQHVGHPIDTSVLDIKIGGSYENLQVHQNIEEELTRLSRIVEPFASSMGYCRPISADTTSC